MAQKTIDIAAWGNETYTVVYDGNVWCNPSTGQQFSRPEHAMRAVLRDAALASGGDPDDEDTADEIEGFVDAALAECYGPEYVGD